MTTVNDSGPSHAGVANLSGQGAIASYSSQWITSVEARGGAAKTGGASLMGYRRDTPNERRRLADELRAKMAQDGISDVRDDEMVFVLEDETPLLCARIREKLISAFKGRQAIDREYLPLDDVVKAWAPFRRESPLTAAKECARSDLIEAALDEDIPDLLYLSPRAPLEHVIDSDGKLIDPVSPDGKAVYLTAASLDHALTMGPLPRERLKVLRTIEMAPHCWARRDAVIAFLSKLGVDPTDMPTAWFSDLPGDITAIAKPTATLDSGIKVAARRGDVPDYDWDEAKLYAFQELDNNGDMQDPNNRVEGWKSQADLTRKVMAHLVDLESTGDKEAKGPEFSTAKSYVSKFIAEWRSRRG